MALCFYCQTYHQAAQAPQISPPYRISDWGFYQPPEFDYLHWQALRARWRASYMVPQHARLVSRVPQSEFPVVRRLRPRRVELKVGVEYVEDIPVEWDVSPSELLRRAEEARWKGKGKGKGKEVLCFHIVITGGAMRALCMTPPQERTAIHCLRGLYNSGSLDSCTNIGRHMVSENTPHLPNASDTFFELLERMWCLIRILQDVRGLHSGWNIWRTTWADPCFTVSSFHGAGHDGLLPQARSTPSANITESFEARRTGMTKDAVFRTVISSSSSFFVPCVGNVGCYSCAPSTALKSCSALFLCNCASDCAKEVKDAKFCRCTAGDRERSLNLDLRLKVKSFDRSKFRRWGLDAVYMR
ncbi:hypothetical protein CERZMDRAFT_88440 [Cercospora zeae-maydis SCOH1-5]|uniref:Uncharacterized protein n=1 Tax=Cercospora zeae-maydis SCOH1-5 TaxID=717836 RepID=A0A6A6F4Y7_9PEZI|nr:hypothetical protein CERZMDRAFT_88440 [Cercospora zeae-maydis SCOH1-5]